MRTFEERLRAMSLNELALSLHLLHESGAGERDDNCVDIAIRLGPNLSKAQFDHAMSPSTGAPTQSTPLQYMLAIYWRQEQQRKGASPLELL
jgi:hypothetical protein